MGHLLVLYGTPNNPADFERYYHAVHVPLAKKVPGLREYSVSNGPVQALAGTAPHLVADLRFDSVEAVHAALASPEGQTAAGDLRNFASGGATLMVYEGRMV